MKFLDTNIFLRFLVSPQTEEDERKHHACTALFESTAENRTQITTSEAILHEVLYVLCSPRQYGLGHQEAAGLIEPLLRLRSFKIGTKRLYLEALELFAAYQFLDFTDALAVVHAQRGDHELLSYDSDFDKIPSVSRQIP